MTDEPEVKTESKVEEAPPAWMIGRGTETSMEGDKTVSKWIRFRIKQGEERQVIFLTDGNQSPVIWEHNPGLPSAGGRTSWNNYFTCLEPMGEECPLCAWADLNDGMYSRYKAQFFTIIDTSEYKDKKDVVHKNQKRLLCAKRKSADLLVRRYLQLIEDDKTLRGAKFKTYRSASDKSPAIGDDWTFMEMIDLSALEDSEQLDYNEFLRPDMDASIRARRMLESITKSSTASPSSEKTGVDSADDTVPF